MEAFCDRQHLINQTVLVAGDGFWRRLCQRSWKRPVQRAIPFCRWLRARVQRAGGNKTTHVTCDGALIVNGWRRILADSGAAICRNRVKTAAADNKVCNGSAHHGALTAKTMMTDNLPF